MSTRVSRVPEHLQWMEDQRIACRGMDVDIFYPDRGQKNLMKAAKGICAGCPLRAECLAYALQYEHYGIWGGKTEEERVAIRQARRKPIDNRRSQKPLNGSRHIVPTTSVKPLKKMPQR